MSSVWSLAHAFVAVLAYKNPAVTPCVFFLDGEQGKCRGVQRLHAHISAPTSVLMKFCKDKRGGTLTRRKRTNVSPHMKP